MSEAATTKNTSSVADDYLELPYHVRLVHDRDEEGAEGWVADVEELPGCMSQGATPNEAVDNVRDAMHGWIAAALEDGNEIPPPRGESGHSGKFLVRLPVSLHAELARRADAEGVSLNQLVTNALAGAVQWKQASAAPTPEDLQRATKAIGESIGRLLDSSGMRTLAEAGKRLEAMQPFAELTKVAEAANRIQNLPAFAELQKTAEAAKRLGETIVPPHVTNLAAAVSSASKRAEKGLAKGDSSRSGS